MHVCVAVFAKAPIPGVCKTRLAASVGDEAAAQLHRAMVLDTLTALQQISADRLVVLAAPEHDGVRVLRELVPEPWEIVVQRGEGFGARLGNGMEDLTAGGDAAVITDSDSPTMPIEPLARGLSHLRHGKRALLGPATDGGYYLIGLSEHAPEAFEGIHWSTSSVADETRQRLTTLGYDILELPPAHDVDVVEDLHDLWAELATERVRAPLTADWLARELGP